MEFYAFVRGSLAWTASIACAFPVTVPILFFAHRIREGSALDDDKRMDSDELWKRAALGGLVLSIATWIFLFADLVLAKWADMPAGIIHVVILLAFVPAGAYLLTMFFAYDDFFHGLGLLTIFFALPIVILWPANAVLGAWGFALGFFESFLKELT